MQGADRTAAMLNRSFVERVLAARRVAYSRMMLTVAALWKIAPQVRASSPNVSSSRPSRGRARSAQTAVMRFFAVSGRWIRWVSMAW